VKGVGIMSLSFINSSSLMEGLFYSGGTITNYVSGLKKNNFDFSFLPNNQGNAAKNPITNSTSFPKTNVFNFEAFNHLGGISSQARLVQSQANAMASLSANSNKTAVSSEAGVLDAVVSKGATVSNFTKTSVNVSSLAATQLNKGDTLAASDNSFGDKFAIDITNGAGKTSTFSVNLSETDNNKSALQAMADAINKSDIGVKATINFNEKDDTVSLSFEGNKTGDKDGLFTVKDDSAANLGNVERSAANANYSVNGVNFSSQSNDNVRIADGVTANLKKEGTTQISYAPDTSRAVESVQNFVNTFNGLKDKAAVSGELNAQLSVLTSTFSRALGFSGISMDSGGKLTISNENTLRDSIASGSFQKNFQGANSFGSKLHSLSNNAYRTAYSSAVQANLSNLLNNAGLLFNGWA